MICDICGHEGARIRHITRSYGKGENILIIENVPVVNCIDCGKSHLTAETLQEIEKIKLHKSKFAKKCLVAVAVFDSTK